MGNKITNPSPFQGTNYLIPPIPEHSWSLTEPSGGTLGPLAGRSERPGARMSGGFGPRPGGNKIGMAPVRDCFKCPEDLSPLHSGRSGAAGGHPTPRSLLQRVLPLPPLVEPSRSHELPLTTRRAHRRHQVVVPGKLQKPVSSGGYDDVMLASQMPQRRTGVLTC